MLTTAIPIVTTLDPIAKYEEIAASLPAGSKYVQSFDYITIENPGYSTPKYLESLYPTATIFGTDGDVGSHEISQGLLGACGTFALIASYASVKPGCKYRLEDAIYPLTPSPIGLYFVRVQDPANANGCAWVAIDSQMPCSPTGGSAFAYLPTSKALAPMLMLKAAATMRGGCFDEITNHPQLGLTFKWFPWKTATVSAFATFAAELEKGALYITSMTQQFDASGAAIKPAGVVYAHAFAVVDTLSVANPGGSKIELVRIENPWAGGSDYVSDYSEGAQFWIDHPDLGDKLADSCQSLGNYWVDWATFLKLSGKTKFAVLSPFLG
jgi:Calpain family cysteine protease